MKNLDFKGMTIYMGLDVHLSSWDLKVMTEHTSSIGPVHMNPGTIEKLVNYIHVHYPNGTYKCVYESGFCGFWIQEELEKRGIETIVVHAADVPTTDKEKRTKTDKVDCTKLAKCLRGGLLKGIYIPSKEQQEDRWVVRQRYRRASEVRAIKNRIKSNLHFFGIEIDWDDKVNESYWSNRMIENIESFAKQKNQVGLFQEAEALRVHRQLELSPLRQIRALSRQERYKDKVSWLRSIKGVGLLTAMVFLTEIGPIDRFKDLDHLIAYTGLIPGSHSSADKERGSFIIKRGNKKLRTAIILSAWVAIRSSLDLAATYESYRKKNMKAQKAIIKIARKLMSRMMYVLKNERKLEYQ